VRRQHASRVSVAACRRRPDRVAVDKVRLDVAVSDTIGRHGFVRAPDYHHSTSGTVLKTGWSGHTSCALKLCAELGLDPKIERERCPAGRPDAMAT
jgi:hypothetical protein